MLDPGTVAMLGEVKLLCPCMLYEEIAKILVCLNMRA